MNSFRTEEIDGLTVDFFSDLVIKYLKRKDFPVELINDQKQSATIDQILHHPNFDASWRNELADVIHSQYHQLSDPLEAGSNTYINIEKLRDPNTVTVTTGQQIHIFLGPLFVVYKVLSCLAHAKKIETENPGIQVVPIFWMATEDHDFEEIASVKIYNEKYTWDIPSNGPVGRLNPKSLLPLLSEIRARMDDTEDNKTFLDLCETAYGTHATFALATHYIMHQLFGDLGIVVLDPDNQRLKERIRFEIKRDVLEQNLSPIINSSIELMKTKGIKAPINTRPINFFYITDSIRNRIELKDDGRYQIIGTSNYFSKEQMEQEIDQFPERFSPNALLRPLYQQAILPNVSYICGGSEIVYWFELKKLLPSLNLIYPYLEIRKSVFILGNAIIKKFDAMNAPTSTLFLNDKNFLYRLASLQNEEINELQKHVDEHSKAINKIITSLSFLQNQQIPKRLEKAKSQFENELKLTIDLAIEHLSNRNNELKKLETLKQKVFGENFVQERNDFIVNNLSTILTLLTSIPSKIDYADSSKIGILVR